MLLEKGIGGQFRGKKLNEIELVSNIYYNSESEIEEPHLSNVSQKVVNESSISSTSETSSSDPQQTEAKLEGIQY